MTTQSMPVDPIEALAGRLHAWRLAPLAAFFLEAHRPLAFLAGQACFLAQPILAGLDRESQEFLGRLGQRLSEDEQAADQLLALLHAPSQTP